ncbi:Aldehyde/histidinol dehydrogenase [Melampsora americana]|nr:Aldehyde/histidinol dehydrogenase [Melampsora americana]
MSERIITISPLTNKPVLERLGPSPTELAVIPQTSTDAFRSFRQTHPLLSQRQAVVTKSLSLLSDRKDKLAHDLTEQMGRPIAYTAKEVATAIIRGEYLVRISQDALADTPGEPESGFRRYIRKEPIGPVLIVFAWNYPYLILVNALIPAILAGNSVILKASPQTPTISEHIQAVFLEAGLPPDVITFFHAGSIEPIEAIVKSPLVKLICFTGSLAGGLAIQASAASRIVPIGLELGGKDPAYVRSDADVHWAAEEIVDGAIFNSGQSCCSIERVYVHSDIYKPFVEAVQAVLSKYKLGDPFDPSTQLGPVISRQSKKTIEAHISEALASGASDLTPENATFTTTPADGNFVKPTLLTGVTHDMRVMREETFGPVIPVMSVTDDAQAIKLMNDSEFGLTASLWSKDVKLAEALAEQIEAGTVFVNRCDYPSPDLAWTGWKNSGRGVTLSKFGFEQFVRLKSFHVKDYPL